MLPFYLLLVAGFCLANGLNSNLPEWKDLECQRGHKYLFSDVGHNWEDSRGECELYGGWLVQINDLAEYTCLLSEGKKLGSGGWYWTDGNDMDDLGYWTHAYDGSAVSFFAHTIGCGCTDRVCRHGGDAFLFNIGGDKHYRGNYCDYDSSSLRNFICENII